VSLSQQSFWWLERAVSIFPKPRGGKSTFFCASPAANLRDTVAHNRVTGRRDDASQPSLPRQARSGPRWRQGKKTSFYPYSCFSIGHIAQISMNDYQTKKNQKRPEEKKRSKAGTCAQVRMMILIFLFSTRARSTAFVPNPAFSVFRFLMVR
jgi:hypothetical protein